MRYSRLALTACGVLLGICSAYAQNLTARLSSFNYFALYGHGGDITRNPTDSKTYPNLVQSDMKEIKYADVLDGTYLQGTYSTSVDISLRHQYSVLGPLSNFAQIDAELHSRYAANASGTAGAGAGGQSTQPGNELLLDFTTTGFHYEFYATAAYKSSGPNVPHGKAELLRWTGSSWTFLESSIFSNGVVRTGNLSAGTYRLLIWGQTKSITNDLAYADTTLRFRNLDAVPEPGSAMVLTAAGLGMVVKRRRWI